MLVLTRRIGERVWIGDGIVITVVSQRGGKVQLGVDAPLQVRIIREEVTERKLPSPVVPTAGPALPSAAEPRQR